MKILTTLAVSALMVSAAYAQSTTTKNTSTAKTRKTSTLDKIKKNFGLAYYNELDGPQLNDINTETTSNGTGNVGVYNHLDLTYKLKSGAKLWWRTPFQQYTSASSNPDATTGFDMLDPSIGIQNTVYKKGNVFVFLRGYADIAATTDTLDKGRSVRPGVLSVIGYSVTPKFSLVLVNQVRAWISNQEDHNEDARLLNVLEAAYKFNDTYSLTTRYLSKYQQFDADEVSNLHFTSSSYTVGSTINISKDMNFFPAITFDAQTALRDETTSLYWEFNYTFF